LLGDRESVDVRQLNVEEYDVRSEGPHRVEGGGAVGGLADNVEPRRLEESAGRRAKRRVVVDDQYGLGRHARTLAEFAVRRIGAAPEV
jgi:hypothetical protein